MSRCGSRRSGAYVEVVILHDGYGSDMGVITHYVLLVAGRKAMSRAGCNVFAHAVEHGLHFNARSGQAGMRPFPDDTGRFRCMTFWLVTGAWS